MRTVRWNPKDPDWTFPYCTRKTLERIREYFESFKIPGAHPHGWREQTRRQTHALEKSDGTPWSSVAPHFRERVEKWFQMKVAQEKAKGIPGWPTPGKIRSLRMNAAYFGRHILTFKRLRWAGHYTRRKRIWLLYQEWMSKKEFVEREVSRPHTASRVLEVG
jgi:hypothetical protein